MLYLWHLKTISQFLTPSGVRNWAFYQSYRIPSPVLSTVFSPGVHDFCVQLLDICMISYIHIYICIFYAYIYTHTYYHMPWPPNYIELPQKKKKRRGPTVRLFQRGDFSAFQLRVPGEFTSMLVLFHRRWLIIFINPCRLVVLTILKNIRQMGL